MGCAQDTMRPGHQRFGIVPDRTGPKGERIVPVEFEQFIKGDFETSCNTEQPPKSDQDTHERKVIRVEGLDTRKRSKTQTVVRGTF